MKRCSYLTHLLFAFFAFAAAQAWAAAETDPAATERKRLAIVLGNSTYDSERYEDLANAANDARKLSESLTRLNFDVLTGTDLKGEELENLIEEAEAKLADYGAVVVFYAGHGVQFKGENYLLPVDTPDPDSVESLTSRAAKLNDIITRLSSRDRQTFIFLDACRNNPLGEGAGDGLAQVEVGENTFIAFATQPGNVTVDGAGENSPFTTALLKNIEIPGLSISDMMIRVRNETEALTVGRQVPWDQSNLREQFYFTEQQVLDSASLSASLSKILSNPSMKEKLLTQLASSDLQTAVLVLGEQLRSVEVDTPGQQAIGGQQVASLAPALAIEDAQKSVVSGLETLIVGSTSGDDEAKHIDLVKSVQTELRRVGCYRMTVDGDWGKGSVRALKDYYRFTDQAESTLEPNVDLLGELFLRSGRVCKQPVKVKPAVTARAAPENQPARRARGGGGGGTAQRAPAPAAPPPDISSGIGIGGVF
ncbi:caspase family protein [Chelativorans sp. AA-79]|uniref:caspase family protein n=1 Tax=Chelativorans sp. AA-79 TaxID=3028735 RepID=UPI0023F811DA|nr:caspase family protein [Chelativorans sp. AA-79]WEX10850.1 caspase family protein [Chelativorans sp. AA-79]